MQKYLQKCHALMSCESEIIHERKISFIFSLKSSGPMIYIRCELLNPNKMNNSFNVNEVCFIYSRV